MTVRIAMWSGPRNISTAMMRSFENRPDTCVIDEPFYAYYLKRTGIDHPGRAEVIASQPIHWQEVVAQITEAPVEAAVCYQKHMTHHMLGEMSMDWTPKLRHCFLIRDPVQVVSSYSKKRDSVTAEDIGIKRQQQLYDEISRITGQTIPVIDARDILLQPETALRCLCQALSIPFLPQMLSWPAGSRSSDGVWAKHWYDSVESSTGFVPYQQPQVDLSEELLAIAEQAQPCYQALFERRLTI
jgi:hypothetical protein